MAYTIQPRTDEIGMRMTMGASRKEVLRLVLALGLPLVVLGVAIGLAGSLALTRVLGALLWRVTPTDPLTYVAVIIALGHLGHAGVLSAGTPGLRHRTYDNPAV